jgi:outer membrane protein assembly factor BamB
MMLRLNTPWQMMTEIPMRWLCVAILGLATTASIVRADDWPQWLGPKRNGGTSEKVAPWKTSPKVAWRLPVEKGFASPVVADGRVFVHAPVKDQEAEEIIALDAATGKEVWRKSYERAAYKSILGRGPRATPMVAGNRVYACGITGVLTCCEADTGKRLWLADTYKTLGQTLPAFGVCCSPLVVGNVVVVSVGGKDSCLVAYDADKGEMLWKRYDEPASTSSPLLFAAPGRAGKLPDAVFMTSLRLLAVNPLDGSLSWEFPLVFQPVGASTTPLSSGDRLFTSTTTNGTTAIQVSGAGDKVATKQLWQNKDVTSYFSTGTVVNKEHLYLVSFTGQPKPASALSCVEMSTGKELWKKEGVGYYHVAVIRTGDNRLLLLSDSGKLRLVEADPKEYRELASAQVCGGTFGVPALSNGRLYVRDDKELVCLELPAP